MNNIKQIIEFLVHTFGIDEQDAQDLVNHMVKMSAEQGQDFSRISLQDFINFVEQMLSKSSQKQ